MPRVHHVKKARKDHPGGIRKGDEYYWWKFRFGPRVTSKTYPKRSQLTRSYFLGALCDLEDEISAMEEIGEDQIQDIVGQLEELREECECSLDNMPEQLRESSESGILLQERIEGLEDWIGELENIDFENMGTDEIQEHIQNSNPGLG